MDLYTKNPYPGLFVLFEGIDGSGKSTHARLLDHYCAEQGIASVLNCEPTRGVFGKIIRSVVEKKQVSFELIDLALTSVEHRSEPEFLFARTALQKLKNHEELQEQERQTLFVLDRLYDLEEIIIPTLRHGKDVIQDRYDLSTYAYYGAALLDEEKKGKELLQNLHRSLLGQFYLLPDLVFFLNLSSELAYQRIVASRKEKGFYETKEYLNQTRLNYMNLVGHLCLKTKVHVLDADVSLEAVHTKIVSFYEQCRAKKRSSG